MEDSAEGLRIARDRYGRAMGELPFRRALVTGASSGIGDAIVRQLGAAGVSSVVVARRRDRLEQLARAVPGSQVEVADLTVDDDLARIAALVADDDRPIDLVVNNAGFGTTGRFDELDAARLDREIALNVAALTRLGHSALGAMIPRGRGWLLNVGSLAGYQPAPRLAVYAATKAYVVNLSESLHEEARPHGVHVTALCPGLTRTEFQQVSNAESYVHKYPGWAWMTADQVAAIAIRDVVRGRAVSVPGRLYKALGVASNVTPRTVMRRAAGIVQRE